MTPPDRSDPLRQALERLIEKWRPFANDRLKGCPDVLSGPSEIFARCIRDAEKELDILRSGGGGARAEQKVRDEELERIAKQVVASIDAVVNGQPFADIDSNAVEHIVLNALTIAAYGSDDDEYPHRAALGGGANQLPDFTAQAPGVLERLKKKQEWVMTRPWEVNADYWDGVHAGISEAIVVLGGGADRPAIRDRDELWCRALWASSIGLHETQAVLERFNELRPDQPAAVPPVVPPQPEPDLIAQLRQDIETLKREGKYKAVEDDFDGDGKGGDWYFALANRIEHLISQVVDHESRRSDGDEQRVTGRVAGGSVDVAPSARTASGVELIGVRPEQGHVQPRDIQQVQRQTVKSAAGSEPADSHQISQNSDTPVRPSLAGLIAQWREKHRVCRSDGGYDYSYYGEYEECANELEALLRVGAVAPPVEK